MAIGLTETKVRYDRKDHYVYQNEDGEVLDVVYDPVLKCYYEPKSNSYY